MLMVSLLMVLVTQSSLLFMMLTIIPMSLLMILFASALDFFSGSVLVLFLMVFIGGLLILVMSVISVVFQEQSTRMELVYMMLMVSLVFPLCFFHKHEMATTSVFVVAIWPMLTSSIFVTMMIVLSLALIVMQFLLQEFKGLTRVLYNHSLWHQYFVKSHMSHLFFIFSGALNASVSPFSYNIFMDIVSKCLVWMVPFGIMVSSLISKNNFLMKVLGLILITSFLTPLFLGFYILFELSLIPILMMILFYGNQPERISAGLAFLIYTTTLSIPYLAVVMETMPLNFFMSKYELSWFLTFLLLSPFLVKMPIMGFHFWLPKAHVEASTSGSMVLAGLLLKLGSYGSFRILWSSGPLLSASTAFWMLLSVLASMTTILQTDIKKLVAYSSITHMTFFLTGIVMMQKSCPFIVFFLSMAHAWASMGMFLSAGVLSNTSSSRMGSLLGSEYKFHFSILLLGALLACNASLPPFPSFFSELFLVSSLFNGLTVFWFMVLSLSVCYYNTYLYLWCSHFKSMESLKGALSLKSPKVIFFLVSWSLLSLLWSVNL